MSFYKAYVVAIGSLLTGAAVVHNVYKPDLVTHRPLLLSFCMQTCCEHLYLIVQMQLGLFQRLCRSTSHNNSVQVTLNSYVWPTSAVLPADNSNFSQAKLKRACNSPNHSTRA